MDTTQRVADEITAKRERLGTPQRQRRSIAEKRRIVEETLVEGASVARVARAQGVNANQVFYWRKLYQGGRLGGSGGAQLLPVQLRKESRALPTISEAERSSSLASSSSTIHIELRQAQVRIEGSADPALVRVLLECLGR